jgi:uncharacterized membrane protein
MTRTEVLLAGESWMTNATHHKGFDQFQSATYHLGAEPLVEALAASPFELRYMPSHEAATAFPMTIEELERYRCVILSDIGTNTLLLHPDVWLLGKPVPNRGRLLKTFVERGGGLMMIGGYLTFQGINGAGRWHKTAVEEVLPVTCLPVDDRVEIPEGFTPAIVDATHPILAGLGHDWPVLLGVNEVVLKDRPDVQVLARVPDEQGGHPLLVTGQYGRGRTVAWTSDIGPHWVPNEFVRWEGYGRLWRQALTWLTRLG